MTLAFMALALQATLRLTRAFLTRRRPGRVGEGMVEGRVVVDREHFMTSHPIRRGSGNVLTHLVKAVLGAGLAAGLLLALDIRRGDSGRP